MSMSTPEHELELELLAQSNFVAGYPKYVCCCQVMNRGTIGQKKQWFENKRLAQICVNCRLLIEGEIYNEPRIKNIVIKNQN